MDTLTYSYTYGTSPLAPHSTSSPLGAYLFGGPQITHSLSPQIHAILFRSSNSQWTYGLRPSTSKEEFMSTMQSPDTIGTSITMPNKLVFMPLMDDLTDEARAIGAINTSFIRLDSRGRRRYIGTNTDCIGVREALLDCTPWISSMARGQPALVIGGGGAARSAIYALWRWFAPSEIYIVNRLRAEVDVIISSMQQTIPGIRLRHVETVEEARSLPSPKIVVGTIPDIPAVEPGEFLAWKMAEAFLQGGNRSVLVDMCYHPLRTRLIDLADRNGWTTISGADVVVRVSVAQQILWLEREPNPAGVQEALASILHLSKL
jgi:quinate dehydrogenase